MQYDEEVVMQMLQQIMQQRSGDLRIGNFLIKQNEIPEPLKKRNNTAIVQSNPYDQISPICKSENNCEVLAKQESQELEAPNDFVQDIFCGYETNLDQFIVQETKEVTSDKSIADRSDRHSKRHIPKQLFQKVYQVLDKFPNQAMKNEIESALNEDFESILKPHISISESSMSLDTLTTLTDTTASDPLRNFFLSLIPSKTQPVTDRPQIDFLFLYSQPLISQHSGQKKQVQHLEIKKEQDSIVDILADFQLRFMAMPARMDLFGEALDLNPLVLHYTGHGIYLEQQQQSFLLFESTNGMAQLISASQIHLSLQKLKNPIRFVFVASCHSKLIGEVFYQAGAEHVICVHTQEKIMDDACRVFVRSFYHGLLMGKQNICDAFKAAKNQVKVEGRFPCSEENKFLLLTRTPHTCTGWYLPKGSFQNLTKICKYPMQQSVPNFCGRYPLMQDVLDKIVQQRVVTLKGVLGIGKSAVARELASYISERNIFKDGVIFLQLNQCDSLDSITSRLSQLLLPNQPMQSKAEIKQLVVTQLIGAMKRMELLLILDNCDLILHSCDREVFTDFLELILSNCTCHLLVTNRSEFLATGKIVKIDGMYPEDAAQLLIASSSREIQVLEVEEVLNGGDLHKFTWNDKILFQRLAAHPLFVILDGHPQGIILAAGLLENYSLKELHHQLSLKQLIDFPTMNRVCEEEKRSLKISLDLSWDTLVDKYEKAATFFAMLGLLPCGIPQDDLDWVWGSGWERLALQLTKNSLLLSTKRNNKNYYCLYSFIVKFAESKLDKKNYRVYQLNIINLLLKRMTQFYAQIGTQAGDPQQPIDDFLLIELNVKACIFREFEEASKGGWEFDPQLNGMIQLKRRNSDSDKKKSVFSDESDNFNLPLTRENLEIMQKRYESKNMNVSQQKQFANSVRFDQSSEERGKSIHTEQPTKRQAFSIYQFTQHTISEEQEHSNHLSDSDDAPASSQQVGVPLIQSDQQQFQSFVRDIKLIKSQPQPKPKKQLKFIEEEQLPPIKNLNKVQVIPKQILKAKPFKKDDHNKNYEEIKKDKVQRLILNYTQILLLLRRYNECLKFVNWAYQYFTDSLFIANVLKTGACAYYMQKEQVKAKQAFKQSREHFIRRGCTLGVASCEAALGYMYLQEREFNNAKVSFENALQFYDTLNHDFGKHFLNRWLSVVKNKISSLKNERGKHIREEKLLIEHLKQEYKKGIKFDNLIQKKHKGGNFILRWLGDTLSIFMEIALVEDSKQKDILNVLKTAEQNTVTHYKKQQVQEKKVIQKQKLMPCLKNKK